MVSLLAYCLDGTRKHAQGLLAHFYQNSSYSRGQRTKEGFFWFLSIFTQDATESSWQYVMAISFLVVQVFYSWIKTCTNCPWSLHWELILVIDLEVMNGSGTGSTDTCHPLWGICPRYSHYRRSDVKDGSPGRTWGTCLCHQGRCRGLGEQSPQPVFLTSAGIPLLPTCVGCEHLLDSDSATLTLRSLVWRWGMCPAITGDEGLLSSHHPFQQLTCFLRPSQLSFSLFPCLCMLCALWPTRSQSLSNFSRQHGHHSVQASLSLVLWTPRTPAASIHQPQARTVRIWETEMSLCWVIPWLFYSS